jgi:uncharacterized protein (TIGR02266 family)
MGIYSYRNRRRAHRVYLRTEISCCDLLGRRHEGVLGNLGEGGLFIHAPAPFSAGSRIRLAFHLDQSDSPGPVEASGVVTWIRRYGEDRLPGFGVRFTEIDPKHQQCVRELLARRREASLRLWSA